MEHAMAFGDILEAADRLSEEEQETLVDVLRRRIAERGRKRLLADVEESRKEFAAGLCRTATPDQIIKEALS